MLQTSSHSLIEKLKPGRLGANILRFTGRIRDIIAFGLISTSIILTKFPKARQVIWPRVVEQIYLSGILLLPSAVLAGLALGLIFIGQGLLLLQQVGALEAAGGIMGMVVFRELAPLTAATLVLARVGTSTVIELGTSRATGEVEALESMGIDTLHYLVMPRVIGLSFAVFSLTVYLNFSAIVGGYAMVFVQQLPLNIETYSRQLLSALSWTDYLLFTLKTLCFGSIIAVVTCFEGLAYRLRLKDVGQATKRAVAWSLATCILVNVFFVLVLIIFQNTSTVTGSDGAQFRINP